MELAVVEEAEELWETWNIRVCILLSLFMQASLTFLAPWRKRSRKLVLIIWLLYLLAEAVALYTIGLISNSSINEAKNTILVFWSPFLLVHLGGPDTITALALEDNELWLRHVLELVTQSTGTFYLFYKSFQTHLVGYDLLIAALIMYVNGCVKYLERCASLYMASMDTFRESLIGKPDAGPNYAALMEEYVSRRAAHIPVVIRTTHDAGYLEDQNTEIVYDDHTLSGECETESSEDQSMVTKEMKLVMQAHEFFVKFRGLIVDTMFTFKERMESREFFLKKIKNGEEAFKVIQIELNFFYDVFFTKFHTVQEARATTRVFSVAAVITSFLLFHSMNNSHKYRRIDSGITYVLLGGALVMDVAAIVMLVFSDWTVVAMFRNVKGWRVTRFATSILDHWLTCGPGRWSEEVPQYDLLNYCLDDLVVFKAHLFKWVNGMLKHLLHFGTSNEFDHDMGNLIFVELKSKAKAAVSTDDTKKAGEARGDLVFVSDCNGNLFDSNGHYSRTLRPWTLDVDYDESLLLWHIATSLCIWNSRQHGDQNNDESVLKYQKYSKVLGSYMMHLLIMKPSMTSSVAGIARVRFQDTCEEVQQFIQRTLSQEEIIGKMSKFKIYIKCVTRLLALLFGRCYSGVKNLMGSKPPPPSEAIQLNIEDRRLQQLCKRILAVNTERKPVEVKGDRSKSVLFDACRLAKELIKICEKDGEKKQWELIVKVWVELLCYAASRSKPTAHIAQLRQGGELISLVWLLMAHFGFGEQFRINKGTGWARLIVDT